MSSLLSIRNKHSSDQAGILLKHIAQEIENDRIRNLQTLETVDVRGKGRLSKSLIKYNDERLSFRRKIARSIDNHVLPLEPDTRYLQLWYIFDHLGPEIIDISNNGHHGTLEGHPTLVSVPIDLGYENMPEIPKTTAMQFNLGTDSISALQGELVVTPNFPRLNVLTNNTLYPTHKKFSISFRFLSSTYAADTTGGGTIFRRFGTKRDNANNGWLSAFDDGGDLVFYVFQNGTWYQRKVDNLLINKMYEAVCTYDESAGSTAADRIRIYVHNMTDDPTVPTTVTRSDVDDSTGSFLLPSDPEYRQFIGGRATRDGYFKGWLQEFRIYAPDNNVSSRQVLSATEVKNLWTNKVTIKDAALGQPAVVGRFNLALESLNS